MAYQPIYDTSTISIYLGTTYGGTIPAGSNILSGVLVSAGDIGNTVTIIGAGVATADPFKAALFKSTITGIAGSTYTLADNAVTAQTAADNQVVIYRKIGSVGSRSWVVQNPGIQFNRSLTQKGSFSFTVWSQDGSLLPLRGMPIWVYDTNPDSTGDVLGGYISKVTYKNEPGSSAVWSTCECVDWAGRFTARLVGSYNSTYTGKTLKQLSEAIVYDHMNAEGFLVSSVTGPSGLSAAYSFSDSGSSAMDDACSKAFGAGNSYYWYIDAWKVVHVVAQNTNTAAWTDLTNCLIQIEQIVTDEKKANRVHASGQELTDATTETLAGNNTKRTFDTSQASIMAQPTIVLNPGAIAQTVGVLHVDTGKDWYWQQNSSTLTQDAGGTTLTSSQSLSVTYQGAVSVEGYNAYSTGIDAAAAVESGTGYHDTDISINAPQAQGSVQAIAVTESKIFADDPSEVTLHSFRGGLHAADDFLLVYPTFGINGHYLIDQVTMTTIDNKAQWEYHMVAGPLRGDWRDPFVNLIGGGQFIGGAGGGGGTPAGIPDGLTFTPALYEYGTFTVENVAVSSPVDIVNIDWYLICIDELTTDVFVTTPGCDATTDPLTITVTRNPSQFTPDATLQFAVGDWVLWNDPGSFEWNQISAFTDNGDGTYDIELTRHYPGTPAGQATFESLMAVHANNTKLFIGQVKRFIPSSTLGGFAGAPVPTRFDFGIGAQCVGAVVAAPVGLGGYGTFVVYNTATATTPGYRTLIGGEFSFQLPGTLNAASGVNVFQDFTVPFDQPQRVNSAYVATAPTGASLKVNLRRSSDNGATWTLVEQVIIAAAGKVSWPTSPSDPPENRRTPYSGTWPWPIYRGGDRVNCSIEQVGSTVHGVDLTVKADT